MPHMTPPLIVLVPLAGVSGKALRWEPMSGAQTCVPGSAQSHRQAAWVTRLLSLLLLLPPEGQCQAPASTCSRPQFWLSWWIARAGAAQGLAVLPDIGVLICPRPRPPLVPQLPSSWLGETAPELGVQGHSIPRSPWAQQQLGGQGWCPQSREERSVSSVGGCAAVCPDSHAPRPLPVSGLEVS